MARSRDIYDLTRLINVKLGISRKDDQPPLRWFKDPVQTGPLAGKVLKREEFNTILDMYYQLRNWDAEGKPNPEIEKNFN
jgi:aldehyde:ferredoxin oxidoreductase